MKIVKLILTTILVTSLVVITHFSMTHAAERYSLPHHNLSLLSDPFLQLPTKDTVNVVWFTEFLGDKHWVEYGAKLDQQITATTSKLSQVREDQDSQLDFPLTKPMIRNIWRHEAKIIDLPADKRLPYRVKSNLAQKTISSNIFTLASNPTAKKPLKILLTSDHQLMPMTTANLSKVVETIDQIDAVFFPGDLVNVPDRASEWFDDCQGGAFFPALQGKANYELEQQGIKTIYRGGEIIQHAPLFTAIGNHEVMGRKTNPTLKQEFNDPIPHQVAAEFYQKIAHRINPANDFQSKQDWIKHNSFNTDTYEEIFSLPQSNDGGKKYYAVTFGNIRLISLYVTNIWRSPSLETGDRGRYKESNNDLNNPERWGYGQHIFEPIKFGSQQYQWLQQELNSQEYQQAKYKIVMLHHPPHTLGGNIVPPYTDPQPKFYDYNSDLVSENITTISSLYYDYPIQNDYIIRDLIPLLESSRVQLVYYGHSHLWNRFQSNSGMHFLESSNVGNSYGAHLQDNPRPIPTYSPENYIAVGDPNGLEPIVPNLAPLTNSQGQPMPHIASNEITVFSILDTAKGTVSSYRYDTRKPNSDVIKFDEFELGQSC